jgi:hypothetical protein
MPNLSASRSASMVPTVIDRNPNRYVSSARVYSEPCG